MKLVAEAVFNSGAEAFWKHHFDESSRGPSETTGFGAQSFRVLSSDTRGGVLHQRTEMVERLDAPAAVRKVFGETTRVTEEWSWPEGSNAARVSFAPDKMASRLRLGGEMRTEELGPGRTKVILDFDVTVKIFGIGGIVEKLLAKDIPERHQKSADYYNAHIAK